MRSWYVIPVAFRTCNQYATLCLEDLEKERKKEYFKYLLEKPKERRLVERKIFIVGTQAENYCSLYVLSEQ